MGKGRIKMANEPVLKSWDDVDLHLKEIGEIDNNVTLLEAEMNKQISDVTLEKEIKAQPLIERRKRLAMEIKEFVDEHKSEFDGKTKVLNFGSVGFRKTTKLVIHNVKELIGLLRGRGMGQCLKVKETVNKDTLAGYPDETLASLGVVRRVKNDFWLEPKYEKLKEA